MIGKHRNVRKKDVQSKDGHRYRINHFPLKKILFVKDDSLRAIISKTKLETRFFAGRNKLKQ